MIIDMHVHPLCKEVSWDDPKKICSAMYGLDPHKEKYMYRAFRDLKENISIDNYIVLMDKFGIDKSVIVSYNVKTAYGITLVTNDDITNLIKLRKQYYGRLLRCSKGNLRIFIPDRKTSKDSNLSRSTRRLYCAIRCLGYQRDCKKRNGTK